MPPAMPPKSAQEMVLQIPGMTQNLTIPPDWADHADGIASAAHETVNPTEESTPSDDNLPDAPSTSWKEAVAPTLAGKEMKSGKPGKDESDKFWTKERRFSTAALAVESALDGYTTQKLQDKGHHEMDPLAAGLVKKGAVGQAAASALGVGAILGAQYLAHKLGHKDIAKWIGRIALAGEGMNTARQVELLKNSK